VKTTYFDAEARGFPERTTWRFLRLRLLLRRLTLDLVRYAIVLSVSRALKPRSVTFRRGGGLFGRQRFLSPWVENQFQKAQPSVSMLERSRHPFSMSIILLNSVSLMTQPLTNAEKSRTSKFGARRIDTFAVNSVFGMM